VAIAWDDGHVAPVDLGEVIAAHKALAPLKKKGEFARVRRAGAWLVAADDRVLSQRRKADPENGDAGDGRLGGAGGGMSVARRCHWLM